MHSRDIIIIKEVIIIKESFITTKEAAKELGLSRNSITRLCREGILTGAEIVGERVWLIPKQSVIDYKEHPKRPGPPPPEPPPPEPQEGTEYISVKEAAEIIQRSTRAVKSYCRWGRLKGAYQQDNEWYIPKSAVLELKERLDKHISPVELREKSKVSKTVLPAVESENVPQGYISVETAAKLRKQTPQYVIRSCKDGRIRGARKDNGRWLIPEGNIK